MKKLLLLFTLSAGFAFKASAQTYNADDFKAKLGKSETLCDTVSSIKIFSDTLTLINMGRDYPNQKYTIAVKGNKIVLDWANLKGKRLCATGVFVMHKNRPEVIVGEPNQITFP
ncbi:M48 family metalloprotease [Mucilaginibacter pedocola]|uniref:Uncharacterized protein n=1 Tax=Mucilaginibacter pedocola TaxID=1792845 RepID=A0A1S9PKV8_9SPHI|nr:hypothetical protein [Mucilaginibacter pedocola]OOQ61559.1 hypothetical protein BC343_00320 [Mucilaginibacter pedocola]